MVSIILFLFLIGMLFYTAIIYNSSEMMVLAFGVDVFAVFSILCLLIRRFTMHFSVEIPIAVADAGKGNLVSIQVQNQSPLVCSRVKLYMICRNTLLGTEQKMWLKASNLFPGNSSLDYSVKLSEAGNYEIQLKKLRIYDITGLLFLQRNGRGRHGISTASLQVLPEIYEIGISLTEAVRNFYGEADVYDEEKAGTDHSEIFQIRPFAEGDKIQNIHWKLSARTDEMMVKENSRPKACAVILLLDHQGSKKQRFCPEMFLTIAASISFSLMDQGCLHYVAWYDEKTQGITRIRVDDEESYYLFLNYYMQKQGNAGVEDLIECYHEKYCSEIYLYMLRLTEELILYKGQESIIHFNGKNIREELGGTEIVL